MSKVIWKFPLNFGNTTVSMPCHAQILSTHVQRDTVCIWALIDEDSIEKTEERYFVIHGTGHSFDLLADWEPKFIGTVLMDDGQLVWHVFEISTL